MNFFIKAKMQSLVNPCPIIQCSVSIIRRNSGYYRYQDESAYPDVLGGALTDRLAGDGKHTISDEMQNVPIKCIHNVVLRDENEKSHEVMLSVRWKKILVKPPIGKSKQYPDITLFAIHAREENETPGRKPLEWKLLTNIPVDCNDNAIEKLEWYAHRWKIETFHKV